MPLSKMAQILASKVKDILDENNEEFTEEEIETLVKEFADFLWEYLKKYD
jgi:predicted glycosyltransferase